MNSRVVAEEKINQYISIRYKYSVLLVYQYNNYDIQYIIII